MPCVSVCVCRAELRLSLQHALEDQACLAPEDIDDALTKAQGRASELETTVSCLLDTARYAADWRTRESVAGWVEDAFRDAKGITKELRSHISLVEVRSGGRGDKLRLSNWFVRRGKGMLPLLLVL